MEEPTHSQESLFWDRVADWVLCIDDANANLLSREEISALARFGRAEAGPVSGCPPVA